jgi:threonine aldolase
MDFRSDNVTGAHPRILEAIGRANAGQVGSYGADPWSQRVEARLGEIFERPVKVFPVLTGTAANVVALSSFVPPWGAIYCHPEAHINVDECGAPELFTGGAKLVCVPGEHGRITPAGVEAKIQGEGFVHAVQPAAISITQASECGTLYTPDQVAALSATAKAHKMALHMDGARFANALVALGCTPAELTWKAGVDVLSFGATKNGCLAAEAVVLFHPEKAQEMAFRRKRGGHLLSKMRLVSAQLEAYLADDLWLANARHANAMARRLAEGLTAQGCRLFHPVEANELFVEIPRRRAEALQAQGFAFYDWEALGKEAWRLVTAFDTRAEDVEKFIAALGQAEAA